MLPKKVQSCHGGALVVLPMCLVGALGFFIFIFMKVNSVRVRNLLWEEKNKIINFFFYVYDFHIVDTLF